MTFNEAFRLDGRVVVVTGGGQGLGLAIAKCMAESGAEVVISGRREETLKKACEEIGEKASYIVFDVTEKDKAPAFIQEILDKKGRIDVLVNNAGIILKKNIELLSQEDIYKLMDVHVFSTFALAQAVIPHMKERGKGNLIFISSMSSFMGLTDVAAYGIAKSAVLGEVRSLAADISRFGIRVNSIAPGWIHTDMMEKTLAADPGRGDKVLGRTPMKQFGQPDDIGWAAVYLASDASKFVNGTYLVVDGGAKDGF